MVLGALAAAAVDVATTGAGNWDMGGMLAGLGTSGRGAKVDQKFQKLFANIDYKIQRQELHRDDIRDLVDLTVSRMDMYNVVGALILTFSLEWVCDNSVVSAEKESINFPRWFSTVFIIHCFSSAGYLLFSLWFSMHCSIVSKAQGTKLLLHFARLSVPIRDEINKLKVRFYSSGPLGRMAERMAKPEERAAHLQGKEGKDAARSSQDDYQASAYSVPFDEESGDSDDGTAVTGTRFTDPSFHGDLEDDNYKNDSDVDFQRHLRLWVKERGKWLSYDAYSRVCMVVGMNQLLQAMSYNLMASLWDVSLMSACLCVLVAKLLSFHVYQIDVVVTSFGQIFIWFFCEFVPPLLTIPLLMLMPPRDAHDDDLKRHNFGLMALAAMPIFLLHSAWMFNIAQKLREAKDPLSATAGASESDTDGSESSLESFADASTHHRRRYDGLDNLPKAFLGRTFVGRNTRSLYQVFRLDKTAIPAQGEDWFDHTPANIVRSFTLAMAGWWILAGVLHAGTSVWEARSRFLARGAPLVSVELVDAVWPAPSSLFEIVSINFGQGSELIVMGKFTTFKTALLPNASLGPFERVDGNVAAVLCGGQAPVAMSPPAPPVCDALVAGKGAWSILPLDDLCTRSGLGAPSEPVPIPTSWRIVAGAWEAQRIQSQGVLAGWDGSSVEVSTLRRDAASSSWRLQPWFRVHPGIGRCAAGQDVCSKWRSGSYDQVVALQFGASGRHLAVLSRDGTLDNWFLDKGELIDRRQLRDGNYTAMCHNGSHVYYTRVDDRDGPLLETSLLPDIFMPDGRGGAAANGQSLASSAAALPWRLKR